MKQFNPKTIVRRQRTPLMRWLGVLALFLGLALWSAGPVAAAPPPAGSVIGNQAAATYTDLSGQTKTATSNQVETTVLQVGSFTLTSDNTKTAAIGNTVYMAHTMTNTGNGSDSFRLALTDNAGTGFEATNIAIYLDANADGVPDSTTPLPVVGGYVLTPSLPVGGTFNFVVSMTVPAGASAGNSDTETVTASPVPSSITYAPASIPNTDTLNVTAAAAFQVNKSISISQGPASGTLTYTLTYKNTGAAAGNLALQDVIGSGATVGYSYAGPAIWSAGNTTLNPNAIPACLSGSGGTCVPGAADATVGGMPIFYEAITAGPVTTINAVIQNVGPNVTGTITFVANVLSTALVGTSTTTNTGSFAVDLNIDPTDNGIPAQHTNPSAYNVLAGYNVVLNDGTAAAADGTNARPLAADTDSAANADLLYIASANVGTTISFSNVVWNTGNTTDTFNVTSTGLGAAAGYSAWPAGTTFQLFKSDGVTPLMDTNGDGIADTGQLAAGDHYTVVLKVSIPANAGAQTGPFDVEKTATSVGDPTKSNKTYDRLGAITAAVVDLANSSITYTGTPTNVDPVGTLTTTNSVLPGQTTTFNLFIRNESGVADTYSLDYSGTNAFSPTTTLPAGWTLKFMDGTSVITSVGPLPAGAQKQITAVITLPANALAGTTNVYFQAKSQVTGANDAKWDAVTVSAVNSLTLAPSNTGQVYPGGTVVYPQTLSNTGNTSCATAPNTFTFTIAESLAAQGWTFVLYKDVNGDGVLDAGDTVIPGNVLTYNDANNILDPGEQVKILVKVFAPAGAAAGSTDVVSIFATSNCALASNTATDTTTVVTGQIRLTKTQTLDVDCDGDTTPDPPFAADKLTAKPGQCIRYMVTATNEGIGNVTDLRIEDSLPGFTSWFPAVATNPSCTVPGTTSATGSYAGSTFKCSNGTPAITLKPAESATMTFSVKVQQ
jgi:trimeric autotransporter adhesin